MHSHEGQADKPTFPSSILLISDTTVISYMYDKCHCIDYNNSIVFAGPLVTVNGSCATIEHAIRYTYDVNSNSIRDERIDK